VVGGSLWLWLRERRRPGAAADDAEERQWSS
jgi:hypothetical protein